MLALQMCKLLVDTYPAADHHELGVPRAHADAASAVRDNDADEQLTADSGYSLAGVNQRVDVSTVWVHDHLHW